MNPDNKVKPDKSSPDDKPIRESGPKAQYSGSYGSYYN